MALAFMTVYSRIKRPINADVFYFSSI